MPGPNNHETLGTPLPVLSQPPKSLPPAPKGTTPGSSNEGFSVEDMASTWAEKMEIPWDQCSPALKNACRDKQIPDKKELLAFNRVLGDAFHLVQPRPGKRALAIIARRVCSKYPQTFKDFVPGFGFLGDGTTTVLNRLVNYIDSKNRTGANSLRRKLYAADNEEDTGGTKRKASSAFLKDSYGSVRWQPDNLPNGETEKSQEERRLWLVDEYTRENQDEGQIHNWMINTYVSQRFCINQKDSLIPHILTEWPFLKKPKCMLVHFKILMDFNLVERLDEQLTSKHEDLLNYCVELGNKKTRAAAANLLSLSKTLESEIPKLTGVLWLLPHLLEEDENLLYKLDEVKILYCNL